jgi:hypothetical protein
VVVVEEEEVEVEEKVSAKQKLFNFRILKSKKERICYKRKEYVTIKYVD